jgi:hypothetical protein
LASASLDESIAFGLLPIRPCEFASASLDESIAFGLRPIRPLSDTAPGFR